MKEILNKLTSDLHFLFILFVLKVQMGPSLTASRGLVIHGYLCWIPSNVNKQIIQEYKF